MIKNIKDSDEYKTYHVPRYLLKRIFTGVQSSIVIAVIFILFILCVIFKSESSLTPGVYERGVILTSLLIMGGFGAGFMLGPEQMKEHKLSPIGLILLWAFGINLITIPGIVLFFILSSSDQFGPYVERIRPIYFLCIPTGALAGLIGLVKVRDVLRYLLK